jgi:hypothetical protein
MPDQPENLPVPIAEDDGGVLALVGRWISGIAAIWQKSLFKAGSKLLIGAAGLGTAYLGALAEDIKHNQAQRAKVREALAKAAIKQVPSDPAIGERALEHFANDILGKQANREKVFEYACEDLRADQPQQGGQPAQDTELDDDWLSGFYVFAEHASTERMQILFGKILAGEIRKPGSFSLYALDFSPR